MCSSYVHWNSGWHTLKSESKQKFSYWMRSFKRVECLLKKCTDLFLLMHLLRNNWVFITFLQMCLPPSKVHYKKLIAYFSVTRIALYSFLTLLAFDAHPSATMWMFYRWRASLSMMSVETVTPSLEIWGEHLSNQIVQLHFL